MGQKGFVCASEANRNRDCTIPAVTCSNSPLHSFNPAKQALLDADLCCHLPVTQFPVGSARNDESFGHSVVGHMEFQCSC